MPDPQNELLRQILEELKTLRSLMEGATQDGGSMLKCVHIGEAIIPA